MIDLAVEERLSRIAQGQPKQRANAPSTTPTTPIMPDSETEQAGPEQKQEAKRWRELLALEDEVRKMVEQLNERAHAIVERERLLSAEEIAAMQRRLRTTVRQSYRRTASARASGSGDRLCRCTSLTVRPRRRYELTFESRGVAVWSEDKPFVKPGNLLYPQRTR